MGYLSQKKLAARESVFFMLSSVIMSVFAVVLLVNPEFVFLGFNLFHFYCISVLLTIAALWAKKIVPLVVMSVVLVITYTLIAMSGNIFLSDKVKGNYVADIAFGEDSKLTGELSKGVVMSGKDTFASYAVINEEAPLMLIKVDLRGIEKKKYSAILRNLHKFVMQQDIEVVVFGDFGMPEWSKLFRRFTEVSGLAVKNRLVFKSLFDVPHFYVLGFNNIGIKDLSVGKKQIKVKVSYDIL